MSSIRSRTIYIFIDQNVNKINRCIGSPYFDNGKKRAGSYSQHMLLKILVSQPNYVGICKNCYPHYVKIYLYLYRSKLNKLNGLMHRLFLF